MIEYIHGQLTELTPALAVVEAAGVGYALNISLNTYTAIQGTSHSTVLPHVRNASSTACSSASVA